MRNSTDGFLLHHTITLCGGSIFIITDESVASAFFYVTKLVKAYINRQWWWLLHNPRNPVVKYIMYRRSLKMAEELMAKINSEKE